MKKYKVLGLMFVTVFIILITGCFNDKDISLKIPPNTMERNREDINETSNLISGSVRVVTNREEYIDTLFSEYLEEFNRIYPNIKVTFRDVSNYEAVLGSNIIAGNDWGEVCMIPNSISNGQLPEFFTILGSVDKMSDYYNYISDRSFNGVVYGIPSAGNVQGVVYNKEVFEKAGIKDLPKTPAAFLKAMEKIKDNTDAVPIYIHYNDVWVMEAWEENCYGSVSGDPEYKNKLVYNNEPFSKGSSHYIVYKLLYDLVKNGYTESNMEDSNWEESIQLFSSGKVGCIVAGSWAIKAIENVSDESQEVQFMPFPYNKEGIQYVSAGTDYSYGINKFSTPENISASRVFVNWMVKESGFYKYLGGIPVLKGAENADYLEGLNNSNIKLIRNVDIPLEDEGKLSNISKKSGVDLLGIHQKQRIIKEALNENGESFDSIMDGWNQRWSIVRKQCDEE